MAYNSKNLLIRIIEVQELTLEHTSRGVTQQWVYKHIIFPKYSISIGTYYAYLRRNAKSELRRQALHPHCKDEDQAQLALF